MTRPQLCLGTVQFGMTYGITNHFGQVTEDEVKKILKLAASSGIEFLDTAQSYGTSELVLGRCWPSHYPKRLISKLSPGGNPDHWENRLFESLELTKSNKLDSFLLHSPKDLLGHDGNALLNWLESLRTRKLVDRIGVSIYSAADLDNLPLERLQLIQLPLSIYDQRLLRDGTIKKLTNLGISVHIRSILMQGLLLQPVDTLPNFLSSGFHAHHTRWLEHLKDRNVKPLEAALAFANSIKGVEAIVFGVLSSEELHQILQIWNHLDTINSKNDWAWSNQSDLDPRRWPNA